MGKEMGVPVGLWRYGGSCRNEALRASWQPCRPGEAHLVKGFHTLLGTWSASLQGKGCLLGSVGVVSSTQPHGGMDSRSTPEASESSAGYGKEEGFPGGGVSGHLGQGSRSPVSHSRSL